MNTYNEKAIIENNNFNAAEIIESNFSLGYVDDKTISVDLSGANASIVISESVAAAGDILLPYTMPQAEYMYGCSATALGMLLGYYDLYGYAGYDVSNIIPGTITVNSRGSDGNIYNMNEFDSVLGNFIASEGYVSRFYETTPAQELQYTFIDGDPQKGLNTAAWDSLADYLGTGQYWRGNGDLSTMVIYSTLGSITNFTTTVTISGLSVPYKYLDMKYGLSLYLESVGYKLDPVLTTTVQTDQAGGSFTFAQFKAEIDAGRSVLVSMRTPNDYGHMVVAYGYNASTNEIIFDDTYRADCRMSWNGTFSYAGGAYSISAITTIVLDTAGLSLLSNESNYVLLYTSGVVTSSAASMSGVNVDSGMRMTVSSGGTATNTTISSGGSQIIYSKGVMNGAVVYSGGMMSVSSGAVMSGTVSLGGSMYIGGTVTATGAAIQFMVSERKTTDSYMINNISLINGASFSITVSASQTVGTYSLAAAATGFSKTITVGNGTTNYGTLTANDSAVNYGSYSYSLVNSSGVLSLKIGTASSGGTSSSSVASNAVKLYSGGILTSSGSIMSGAVVNSGMSQHISSGGITSRATVNSGGRQYISSGGIAASTTVNSGGSMIASSGQSFLSGTTVLGGTMIMIGGVDAQNSQVVFAINQRTTTDSYIISNIASISNAVYTVTVNSSQASGTYTLAAGASGFNKTITVQNTSGTNYGTLAVGGSMTYSGMNYALSVNTSGVLQMSITSSSGGGGSSSSVASNAVKLSSGGVLVSSGTSMIGVTVNSGMSQHVSTGGITSRTTINSGGRQYVSSGGTATSTTVNSGGYMYVLAGAVANSATLNAGNQYVSSGGSVNGTIVKANGYLRVSSGGTVRGASTESHGSIYADNTANIYDVKIGNSGSATILGTISGVSIGSQGYLMLSAGAVGSDIDVLSGGRAYLRYGGSAGDITVSRGGVLVVNSSGTLTGNVQLAGLLKTSSLVSGVLNGGNNTLTLDLKERLTSDTFMIDNLANLTNINISVSVSEAQSSGIYLLAGGAASFTGSVKVCGDSGSCITLSVGKTASLGNLTCSLTVENSMLSISIQNSGSEEPVSVDKYVPGTWSTDWAQASAYAKANNMMIFAYFGDKTLCGYCGYMNTYLFEAEDFKELSKSVVLLYDTPVPGKTYSGSPIGYLLDADGNSVTYRSGFGADDHDSWMTWLKINLNKAVGVYLYSYADDFSLLGTTVASATISSGYTVYVNSATLSNGIVSSGGYIYVNKNGITRNAQIELGGRMYVKSGGVASGTTINAGGYMHVNSGGIVRATSVESDGRLYVSDGGVASSTVINTGYMYVFSGGTVNSTTVNDGVTYVSSGGAVSGMTISGGSMRASNGAGVVNTTIKNGGRASLWSEAVNTTISSGGVLYISSGTCHSGTLNIISGAVVSAVIGAAMDFTVAGRTTSQSALVTNYNLINGYANFSYSITVDVEQAAGIYKLASNASYYKYSATVKCTDGTVLGNLSVGSSLTSGLYTYSMTLASGNLNLTVEKAEPVVPVPRTNLMANGYSQVVAWDSEKGKVGYMAINGQVAPDWAGIWEWSGDEASMWRVVGVGHFSNDVKQDGILLYNGFGNTFAAWTNLNDGSYGYISLCHVDGNFQTLALADFDNNGLDDVIIYDENGSFGIVSDAASYHDVWHVEDAATNIQQVIGAGYFGNADGKSDILVKNTATDAYFLWHNEDPTFATWNWSQTEIGTLDDDWVVAAIGDFQGDGVDDIIMWQQSTGFMYAWEDGKASDQRWVGALDPSDWEVAAVGDYNGDGKEDLLLRELNSGWGGIGYWAGANASNWTDLNARIETDMESKFAVVA